MGPRMMSPLMRVVSSIGLCPMGEPPQYKPSSRTVLLGLLNAAGQLLGTSVLIAHQLMYMYTSEKFILGMTRILTITADSALFLGFLGLLVGYCRKVEHIPKVLEMSDCLPGHLRCRVPVFIMEMAVFCVPPAAYSVRIMFEPSLLSHVDAFAILIVLSSLEKFVFLHLVARVGLCFDAINLHLEAITLQVTGSDVFSSRPVLSDKICHLRQLHLQACALLEQITRSFELQVLVILVVEFIMTVLLVYIMALKVYHKDTHWLYLALASMIVLVVFLTALVLATCRKTSAKGNKSPMLVHNMINNGSFCEEEVQQLIFFSMQTVHQEISVTPYDLVALDYSLLRSFVGSVAMYVVILVQFNVSSGSPAPP